jgi:hypothetical protein
MEFRDLSIGDFFIISNVTQDQISYAANPLICLLRKCNLDNAFYTRDGSKINIRLDLRVIRVET